MKRLSLLLIMIAALMLSLAHTSFAAIGLNAVLSSQNPDPVSPGNFVFVNLKLTNAGESNIENTVVTFIENDNFKIAQGSDEEVFVGTIPGSRGIVDDDDAFDIAKFRLFVDEETPVGLNTVEFEISSAQNTLRYEFEVLVQDQNPKLSINSFTIKPIEPGKTETLSIEVENPNSVALKNVFLTLKLDDVEDTVFSTQSSNQKVINKLEPNEKQIFTFDLTASPDATSQPYLLPVVFDFDDALDNNYSTEITGSVQVFSEPLLAIKLDSQELYSQGSGKISFAIANPGTSTIKGTQVEVLAGENTKIIDGDFHYVGDLNPDDFQTIQSNVVVKEGSSANIIIKTTYLDSYNNKMQEESTLPIKIFNEEELKSAGIQGQSSGGSSPVSMIVTLVLLIVVYFVGRHFGIKKGKKAKQ